MLTAQLKGKNKIRIETMMCQSPPKLPLVYSLDRIVVFRLIDSVILSVSLAFFTSLEVGSHDPIFVTNYCTSSKKLVMRINISMS